VALNSGYVSGFSKLLDFLGQQTWIVSHSAFGGLLDFSAAVYGGSGENALFTAAQQFAIDTLIGRGWSVFTPGFNTPAGFGYYPVSSVSNVGITNRYPVNDAATAYAAIGDGVDLPVVGALYVCDTDSFDPIDWQFVASFFPNWPQRTEHATSVWYYITQVGSDWYVVSNPSAL
jgi:hypothetical protein